MNETAAVDLQKVIAKLEAVALKMMYIDADDLDQDKKNELAEKLNDVALNLTRLRTADLKSLADEFKAKEPGLRRAAAKLEEDLSDLTDAVEIVNTVAASMKTITDVVKLLG